MKRQLVWILPLLAQPVLGQEEIDAVADGRQAFATYGCITCHVVDKNDKSVRSGPSLYGLFLNEPREREILVPGSKEKKKVRADKGYYLDSVRKSTDVLAIAESGATKGQPYPAAMPMYSSEVIPDQAVEHIFHYLRTLADEGQAGPGVVKVKIDRKAQPKNLLEIGGEVVVSKRTRVFRAPISKSSGRAVHVGLPNGMNYTFDPRTLSIRNVWGGGFLNLNEERRGRGHPNSKRGQGSQTFIEGAGILRPVSGGTPVDFEFKEPDVKDHKNIEKWLWEDRDFSELLASVNAEYRGHSLDSATGDPVFRFRVGSNEFQQGVRFAEDGRLEVALQSSVKTAQVFQVSESGLTNITVKGGTLANGTWTLPAGPPRTYTFSARLQKALVARPLVDAEEHWGEQPVCQHFLIRLKLQLQLELLQAFEV